jgi:alkylated DNA nucleotide flippase Atl1
MEELLRAEGVEFLDDGCVNMEKYFWDPTAINK